MKLKFLALVVGIILLFGLAGVDRQVKAEANPALTDFIEYTSSPTSNVFQFIAGEVVKNVQGAFEMSLKGVVGAILNTVYALIAGLNVDENGMPQDGALNLTSKVIASMYATPPASGVAYAYDVLHNLGIKSAYAANGVGFGGLQPILPMWKAFRNLSYSIFAIIFVFIGILVMLRVKISAQAMFTIESILPKVISALIAITFSYAIAGAMIDLLYIVASLAINALSVTGINPTPKPQDILQSGFFAFIPMIAISTAGATMLGAALTLVTGGLSLLVGAPILLPLLWLIISLFLVIKLLIALIKTYVYIILGIILAPLQIMLGVLPSIPFGGVWPWVKNLFANIMVFPAVAVVMVIGSSIITHSITDTTSPMWYPPLITPPDVPILSDFLSTHLGIVLKSIIGLGILLLLPNIPDIVRNFLGVKDT
ncbi:MAG: hypothetical protein ABID04_03910, partial [Patescibacteria group bacterium]